MTSLLPPPAVFSHNETLHAISLPPLATFLSSLTAPDHLLKLKDILDRYRTPKSYHRVDVREVSSSELPPCSPSWEIDRALSPEREHVHVEEGKSRFGRGQGGEGGGEDKEAGQNRQGTTSNGGAFTTEERTNMGLGDGRSTRDAVRERKRQERLAEEEREKGEPIELQPGLTMEEYRALQSVLEGVADQEIHLEADDLFGFDTIVDHTAAQLVEHDPRPVNGSAHDSASNGKMQSALTETPLGDHIDVLPRSLSAPRPHSFHIDGLPRKTPTKGHINPLPPAYRPQTPPHPLPPPAPKRQIRELRLDIRSLDAAALFALETWRRSVLGLDKLDMEHPDSIWYKAPDPPEPGLEPEHEHEAVNFPAATQTKPEDRLGKRKRGRPKKVWPETNGEASDSTSQADETVMVDAQDAILQAMEEQGDMANSTGQETAHVSSVSATSQLGAPMQDSEALALGQAQDAAGKGDAETSYRSPSPDIILDDIHDERPDADPDFVPPQEPVQRSLKKLRGRPRRSQVVVELPMPPRRRTAKPDGSASPSTGDRPRAPSDAVHASAGPSRLRNRRPSSSDLESIEVSNGRPENPAVDQIKRSSTIGSYAHTTSRRSTASPQKPIAPTRRTPRRQADNSSNSASASGSPGPSSIRPRSSSPLPPSALTKPKRRRETFDGVEITFGRNRSRSTVPRSSRSEATSNNESPTRPPTKKPRKSEPVVRFVPGSFVHSEPEFSPDIMQVHEVNMESEGEDELDSLDEVDQYDELDSEQEAAAAEDVEDTVSNGSKDQKGKEIRAASHERATGCRRRIKGGVGGVELGKVQPKAKAKAKGKGKAKQDSNGEPDLLDIIRATAGTCTLDREEGDPGEWGSFLDI